MSVPGFPPQRSASPCNPQIVRQLQRSLDAGAGFRPAGRLPQGNCAYARPLYLSSSARPIRSPSGPRM
jgi:hypothetical protein